MVTNTFVCRQQVTATEDGNYLVYEEVEVVAPGDWVRSRRHSKLTVPWVETTKEVSMSADNGFLVKPLYQDKLHRHGVFYYSASQDYDSSWYTEDNAEETHVSAVRAILMAHTLDAEQGTEYGVRVSPQTRYSGIQEVKNGSLRST